MIHQTVEKLLAMNLPAFAEGLKEQSEQQHQYRDLSFEERLAFLVDREFLRRANDTHQRKRKNARIRADATVENVNFALKRSLQKSEFMKLAEGTWIKEKRNLIISGATGIGKTFLAGALADKACREGMNALVIKLQDLLSTLMVARADGSFEAVRKRFSKIHLLVIDEWMREQLPHAPSRELLDLIDERYQTASTLFAAQLPVKEWFNRFDDPTIADALLDRIIHNAYRLELTGPSVRKDLGL